MTTFRKVLFWTHLVTGCIAGLIILVMSATGVLLTYERQILAWADRGPYRGQPAAGSTRLGVDALLQRYREQKGELPRNASLVIRRDPAEPAEINLGREGSIYLNSYDGRVLGSGDRETQRWFQRITAWHRWLGAEGAGRATAKAITGACNLMFLFIVASGIYLWLPKIWSKQHLRPIAWFKGGLTGKARDFNWHNVFGIWTAVPLLIVVASAAPMSYTWANDLLYRLTGSEIPRGPGPGPNAGGGQESRGAGRRNQTPVEAAAPPQFDAPWARAEQQASDWQSIALRLPGRANSDLTFTIDTGDGGQPQRRGTLTLDGSNGALKKWETFADNSAGRQLRMWTRFAHTGEYYGLTGQTVAGVASLAGVVLVWTGISLALRRLWAWRGRRQRKANGQPEPALVESA